MPRADALPEPLKPLARRNAVRLTYERFKADAQGLIKMLEDALAGAESAKHQAVADEQRRAAEQAAESEEAARKEKERARLQAIAGLSPEHIAKAEELANWDFIKASQNIQDFRDHLARFPKGVTERMARTKLEALVWAGLAVPVDVPALEGFLEEFPNGAHAGEAKSKLAELKRLADAAARAEESHRREMEAWASASAAGTVAAFEDFLRAWPESNQANVARERIAESKGMRTRRWMLQGLGAAGGLAVVAGAIVVGLQPGFLIWRALYDQSIRTYTYSGPVRPVAFAPDGRTALSGSDDDNTLTLWDIANGHAIRKFTGSGPLYSAAFTPDGHTALSGSDDNTLTLWDIATGDAIRRLSGPVRPVAFARDGRAALSGSEEGNMLKLWSTATGREIRPFEAYPGHSVPVSLAFAPDGRTALSGSDDNTLTLWDLATGRVIRIFTGHSRRVLSVAFAPDGRTALSGSDDNTLKLWDLATGQEILTFTGHSGPVGSVAFAPDGRTALSGSDDNTLKLWDIGTGHEIHTYTGHSGPVGSVAFAPDGRTALSGSYDHTLKLWRLTSQGLRP
jgi:WD40 repeat protein